MRIFWFLILGALPLAAADPQLGSSTLAVGVGGAFAVGGELTAGYHSGPSFSGEYEFGLHKYFAATIGVENYLLNVDQCDRFGCVAARQRFTLMPFGVRGILPLAGDRAELFVGTGGARLWATDDIFGGPFQMNKVLWQANGGVRVALDRGRRFRVGPVFRLSRDLGRPTQAWLSITGELSYRFGR